MESVTLMELIGCYGYHKCHMQNFPGKFFGMGELSRSRRDKGGIGVMVISIYFFCIIYLFLFIEFIIVSNKHYGMSMSVMGVEGSKELMSSCVSWNVRV